jgi:hypothetical protein
VSRCNNLSVPLIGALMGTPYERTQWLSHPLLVKAISIRALRRERMRQQTKSAVLAHTRSGNAPPNNCGFDADVGMHASPSPAVPATEERNDVRADVVLAKDLKR